MTSIDIHRISTILARSRVPNGTLSLTIHSTTYEGKPTEDEITLYFASTSGMDSLKAAVLVGKLAQAINQVFNEEKENGKS